MTNRSAFWCVKSVITIMIVATFCILTLFNPDRFSTEFMCIASSVVTWYFSYQHQKQIQARKDDENANEGN